MTTTKEERGRTDEEREYYALNRKVFSKLARFYDIVTLPLGPLRREVAEMAGAGAGSRVLDVATGTGAQALAFAEKRGQVAGVDLSPHMLRIARTKNRFPNLTFLQADATELPFEGGTFDVACISFALHEMPHSVRERVLREMARVTKPDGTVVVVDYGLPRNAVAGSLVFRVVKLYERDNYANFVRIDLCALLQSAGIVVREDRPALLGVVRIVIGRKQ